MDEHIFNKEETLRLIKEVEKNPAVNQRFLSRKLDISLGKTNYLLKELAKKGIIKILNFSKNPGKAKKVKYLLTKKGIQEKINLTYHFLKMREKEYKRLKEEYREYITNLK